MNEAFHGYYQRTKLIQYINFNQIEMLVIDQFI